MIIKEKSTLLRFPELDSLSLIQFSIMSETPDLFFGDWGGVLTPNAMDEVSDFW